MGMKTIQFQLAFNTFLILYAIGMTIELLVIWLLFNVPYMIQEANTWKISRNSNITQ